MHNYYSIVIALSFILGVSCIMMIICSNHGKPHQLVPVASLTGKASPVQYPRHHSGSTISRSQSPHRSGSSQGHFAAVPSPSPLGAWPFTLWRSRPRILFYNKSDPYYGFTNFSPHPVIYNHKRFPTSEHLFQSFKFEHDNRLVNHIRTCSTNPRDAFNEAQKLKHECRADWHNVNIEKMEIALWHKFTQHHDLRHELLSTGNAELIEDSNVDDFWGWGANQRGRNELGKALERLRDKLKTSASISSPSAKCLCIPYRQTPGKGTHPFYGKTCTEQGCKNCLQNPRSGSHAFCSKFCAAQFRERIGHY